MKFTEIVDLVLLQVNGGDFTTESAVMRADVEAYVPAAAQAAIRESIFQSSADGRAERNSLGMSGATIGPAYYRTYDITLQDDTDRDMKYADLPGLIQDWPGDRGISAVLGKKAPNVNFTKLSGPGQWSYVSDLADAVDMYWHETSPDATATRLYFPTVTDLPCSLLAIAAIQITSDMGDAEVAIPSGVLEITIQKCVTHFRGQREMPEDVIVDNHDVNAPGK